MAARASTDNPVTPQGAPAVVIAKATRQSTNTTVQQAALKVLNCSPGVTDPLIDQDDPDLPLVTCDNDGQTKYVLGPTLLDGEQITTATAGRNPNGPGYVVNLTFNSAGSKVWADYTASHVNTSIAVVVDTAVVSAENIQEAIPGGNTQISGNFTQQQAQQLANALASR
jgi:preprotein translocase subunit SecD